MAEAQKNPYSNRTDSAETGAFLRRMLLKYGYDNLPNNAISDVLKRLGPLGDIGGMAFVGFLADSLTPRGTNTPPAGVVMVKDADGKEKPVPAIELFDKAMRASRNAAAKGMAGETLAMLAAPVLGIGGLAASGLMALGNFAARSGIPALTPPNWLTRMFIKPGTNLQEMSLFNLSREMVTFSRAKMLGIERVVLGGEDLLKALEEPTKETNKLTMAFDRVWKLEKRLLPDPELGPMHQTVRVMADYLDKTATPVDRLKALDFTSFRENPSHPYYTSSENPESKAMATASNAMFNLAGIPEIGTANTAFLEKLHRSSVRLPKTEAMMAAREAAKSAPNDFSKTDWSLLPPGSLVTIATRHNPEGINTETFKTEIRDGSLVFVGQNPANPAYSVDAFKEVILDRASVTRDIVLRPSREIEGAKSEEMARAGEPLAAGNNRQYLGKGIQFLNNSGAFGGGRQLPAPIVPGIPPETFGSLEANKTQNLVASSTL